MSEKFTKWGADSFQLRNMNFKVAEPTLEAAVRTLKAKTKQAFYAAIIRNGVIHRRTWNGCAFNAGSFEVENAQQEAISFATAAQVFGETPAVVRKFIQAWDSSKYPNDNLATINLKRILEEVGIYSDPDTPEVTKVTSAPKKRVVVQTIFESSMTDEALMAELEEMVVLDQMNEELTALLSSAESLVSVNA